MNFPSNLPLSDATIVALTVARESLAVELELWDHRGATITFHNVAAHEAFGAVGAEVGAVVSHLPVTNSGHRHNRPLVGSIEGLVSAGECGEGVLAGPVAEHTGRAHDKVEH